LEVWPPHSKRIGVDFTSFNFFKKKLDKFESGNFLPFYKSPGRCLPITLPLYLPPIDRRMQQLINSNLMSMMQTFVLIKECA
jgi:hypothetical protein